MLQLTGSLPLVPGSLTACAARRTWLWEKTRPATWAGSWRAPPTLLGCAGPLAARRVTLAAPCLPAGRRCRALVHRPGGRRRGCLHPGRAALESRQAPGLRPARALSQVARARVCHERVLGLQALVLARTKALDELPAAYREQHQEGGRTGFAALLTSLAAPHLDACRCSCCHARGCAGTEHA